MSEVEVESRSVIGQDGTGRALEWLLSWMRRLTGCSVESKRLTLSRQLDLVRSARKIDPFGSETKEAASFDA